MNLLFFNGKYINHDEIVIVKLDNGWTDRVEIVVETPLGVEREAFYFNGPPYEPESREAAGKRFLEVLETLKKAK